MKPSPSDARIRADLDLAAEAVDRLSMLAQVVDVHGRDVIARITWEMSDGVKAAAPSQGGGRQWCWAHQRDLSACHRDALACTGETLGGTSDPTGETAITHDSAQADRRRLADRISTILRCADEVTQLIANYPPPHEPTLFDLELTDGCQSCARIGVWSQVNGKVEIRPGEERRLCNWCGWEWFPKTKDLPSLEVLQAHHQGGRIYIKDGTGDVVWQGKTIDNIAKP